MLVLSVLTQAVFLVIGFWDYTVLLGNLLSGAVAIANFFSLGLTVQSAVAKDEKEAKELMRSSGAARTFLLFLNVVLGYFLPIFSLWTVIIPLFFPRIAIAFRPICELAANKREKTPSSAEESLDETGGEDA